MLVRLHTQIFLNTAGSRKLQAVRLAAQCLVLFVLLNGAGLTYELAAHDHHFLEDEACATCAMTNHLDETLCPVELAHRFGEATTPASAVTAVVAISAAHRRLKARDSPPS